MNLRARILMAVVLMPGLLWAGGSHVAPGKASEGTGVPTHAASNAPASISPAGTDSLSVRTLMSTMSLEDKVAQLFIIRPEARNHNAQPGGYCLFASNIESPHQLDSLTKALKAGKYAPVLCIDEEGGRVARIGGNTLFNTKRFRNVALESPKGEAHIQQMGSAIGQYLRRYNFDIDFAPVADVNTNPDNPVIGERAFSNDPATVSIMSQAFLRGLQKHRIAGCLKHYPGHGDTSTDSHTGTASTDKTWEEMLGCELLPFITGIRHNVPLIMVGHVTAPKVDTTNTASSLSHTLVTEKLKGELGYKGVIISDSLGMGAVSTDNTSAQVAVKAFLAGIDILLMPENFAAAYNGVLKAVKDGTIPQQRLDESIFKILMLKKQLGRL